METKPNRKEKDNFFIFVFSFILLAYPFTSYSLPEGEEVVAGSANFDRSQTNTLNVNTSSAKLIVDYNSFSIARPEAVHFHQPSSSSVALNRVVGADPSNISGTLTANGRLFLVNPNGILFGRTARVDAAGLVASTLDISNDDFLAGRYNFNLKQGFVPSYVVNRGSIKVDNNGFVVLVSPLVSNEGEIIAQAGEVVIAGATAFGMSFDEQGLINFVIPRMDRKPGTVTIPKEEAFSLIEEVVNKKGIVEAARIVEEDGVIKLVGSAGIAVNSGLIDVSSSGDGKAGKVSIDSCQDTVLTKDAFIKADGGLEFSGGNIRVFSAGDTSIFGNVRISAKGGRINGKGGNLDISAEGRVGIDGLKVDLSSNTGMNGNFVIDPDVVNITGDIYSYGADIIYQADESINVSDNIVISSRDITGGDTKNAHLSMPSKGDSGDIKFSAPTINIGNGVYLLAFADNGYSGGDVVLSAKDIVDLIWAATPGFKLKASEASINIGDSSFIKANNISLTSTASTAKLVELGEDVSSLPGELGYDIDESAILEFSAFGAAVLSSAKSKVEIGDGATLSADNDIIIGSQAYSNAEMTTIGLYLGVAYGRSEAVAESLVNSGAKINAGNSVSVAAATSNTLKLKTYAGSASSKGVDISFTYGKGISNSRAIVEDNVSVKAKDVNVIASNNNNFLVSSGTFDMESSKFGAAASVVFSDMDSSATASLNGTVSSVNNIVVNANSINVKNKATTSAMATNPVQNKAVVGTLANKTYEKIKKKKLKEKSNAKLDLAAAVTFVKSQNKADSHIADGADVDASGDIDVSSRAEDNYQISASGSAGDGTIAVGGAVAFGDYNNEADAYIGKNAKVDASKSLTVSSESIVPSQMTWIEGWSFDYDWPTFNSGDTTGEFIENVWDFGVGTISEAVGTTLNTLSDYLNLNFGVANRISTTYTQCSGSGDKLGIAGAVTFVNLDNISNAYIDEGAKVNTDSAFYGPEQSVLVNAYSSIDEIDIAGLFSIFSLGFGTTGEGSVGGSYVGGVFRNTAKASIKDGAAVNAKKNPSETSDKNDIKVNAEAHHRKLSVAEAGGNSDKFTITGAFNTLDLENTALAYVEDTADLSASHDVDIEAKNEVSVINVVAGVAKSDTVGIGAGVSWNDIDNVAKAFIGNVEDSSLSKGEINAGHDLILNASSKDDSYSFSLAGAAGAQFGIKNKLGNLFKSIWAKIKGGNSSGGQATGENNDNEKSSSKFGLGVSGDAGLNFATDDVQAYISDGVDVTAGNDVIINAKNLSTMLSVAAAAAGAKTVGLGGVFSHNHITKTTKAFAEAVDLTVSKDVDIYADSGNSLVSISGGGSGSQKVALAGAANTNWISNDTLAALAKSTKVSSADNIFVNADNYNRIISAAVAIMGAGKVGIGGAVDFGIVDNDILAYLGDDTDITAQGNISLISSSDDNIIPVSAAFGGAGKIGLTGAGESYTITNNVSSFIGKRAKVRTEKNLLADADDDTDIIGVAGAAAGGGTAGVGGSAFNANIVKNIKAYIDELADVTAKAKGSDPITIELHNVEGIQLDARADDDLKIFSAAGSGGGKAGVAGAVNEKTVVSTAEAYIGDNAKINVVGNADADGAQSVVLRAKNDTGILGIGGSASGGGTAGVGASGDVDVLVKHTNSYIGKNAQVNAKKHIDISSTSKENVFSITAGAAGGGTAGIAGAASALVVVNNTLSFIDSYSDVESDGNILLLAQDDTDSNLFVGSGAGGGTAGVGGSVAANTIVNNTKAFIADGAYVVAKAKRDSSDVYDGDIDVPTLDLTVTLPDGNNFSFGIGELTDATKKTKQFKGLNINAFATEDLRNVVVGGSGGGTAGVAGTLSVNIVVNNTSAYIGKDAVINDTSDAGADQSVEINAFDYTGVNGYGGVVTGGGTAGVGGSADTSAIFKNTSAWVDERSKVKARKDIGIRADSLERISSMMAGLSGAGTAGVSGTVSFALIKSDTHAFTVSTDNKDDRVILEAGNDIRISASDESRIFQFSGIIGGGGTTGVGGSLTAVLLENDITAELGDFTESNARHKTSVAANSEENIDSFAVGGTGAGTAGVAGSLVLRIMDVDTHARIGRNSELNQNSAFAVSGQSIEVSSSDKVKVLGISGAAAAGGTAGVGGSLDLTVVKNRVIANIDADAKVYSEDGLTDADGVLVRSDSEKVIDSLSIAGTGAGTAAVAGAVSVVSVGAKFEDDVQNHLTGKDTEGNDVSTGDYVDQKGEAGISGQFGSIGDIEFTDSNGNTTSIEDFIEDKSSISVSGDMNQTSNEPLTDTAAYIGDGAEVKSKGEVNVLAKDALTVNMSAGSAMGAGTAAVGGAGAFMLSNNTTRAFIGDNARIDAKKLVSVNAESSERIIDATVSLGGAGTAAVAGSLLLNVINTGTYAYIDSGAEVNQDNAYKGNDQSVTVEADSKTVLTALGGTGGAAATAGIGATAVVNTVVKDTKASIGKSARVSAKKQIDIVTNVADDINSGAVSLQGAGVAAVGGVISTNTIVNSTESLIDEGAVVDSDGNIRIFSEDDSLINSLSGNGNIAGTAAVGGSVSINTLVKHTYARIADDAVVNARGNGDDMDVYTGEIDGNSDIAFVGGAVDKWNQMVDSVTSYNQTRTPVTEDGKKTRKMKGVSLTASSTEDIFSVTTGVGGAIVAGVTGSGAINTITTTTEASIGNDVKLNENNNGASSSQEVYLNSLDHSRVLSLTGVVAGAVKVGVGGGIATNIITKNVRSFIGGSDEARRADQKNIVKSKGNVSISAVSSDQVNNIIMNLSVGGIAGVGGAIAANVIANQVHSYIADKGKVDTDGDLLVKSKDDSYIDVTVGNGAFGIGGGVGGAVSVNVIANSTRSSIGDDALTNASGITDVFSDAVEDIEPIVIAGGAAGLVGVSGSINVDIIKSTTQSKIGDRAEINQDNSFYKSGQYVKVRSNDSAHISSKVGGGGVAAGIGAGGAADVNILRNSATAHIGNASKVKAYEDILVDAHTDKLVDSYTGSVGAGIMSGLSGSISISAVGGGLNYDARDSLGGSANGESGDSIEYADSVLDFNPIEEEENGFESDGKTHWSKGYKSTENVSQEFGDKNNAVKPSSDVDADGSQHPLSSTQAFIGSGAVVEAGRNLIVRASDTSHTRINAGGLSVAFQGGLSGAFAANILSNSTEAYIEDGAKTKAAEQTLVEADEDEQADTISISGGAAVFMGSARSNGITVIDSKTKAHINKNAVVNASCTDGNTVNVRAVSDSNINSVIGGGAGGLLEGVGSSYNACVVAKTTEAYFGEGSSVNALKGIKIDADSSEEIDDSSICFGVAAGAGQGIVAAVYSLNNNTIACIKDGASVDTDGSFMVNAKDDTALKSIAGSAGVSGVLGVGGSLNVNVITSNTRSYIADNVTVRAKGLYDSMDVYTGELADDGDPLTPITDDVKKTSARHGVFVTAFATEDILSDTTGLSVGTGNVSGAVGVEIIKTDTNAYIGNNVSINANEHSVSSQEVYVLAADHTRLVSSANTLSGGLVTSVGGSVDTGIFAKDTRAHIGNGSVVKSGGDITVQALSREDTEVATAALAGSLVGGMAGSVSVRCLSNSTDVYVGSDAHLDSGNNIRLFSSDRSTVDAKTGSASVGLGVAGFGGAVSVVTINNFTESHADSNTNLKSAKDVDINADSSETIDSVTVAGAGGGLTGVAGSVSVNVVTSKTHVYTKDGVNIDAGSDSSVKAEDTVNVSSKTGGGALSIGLGVGAGVDVDVIRTDTGAYLGTNNTVTADNLEIRAVSEKSVNSKVISASGGLACGITGAVSIVLAGADLSGDSRDESGNTASYSQEQASANKVDGYVDDVQGTDVKSDINNVSVESELNKSSSGSMSRTFAYMGDGSSADIENNLSITSSDSTDIDSYAGGFALGLLGIGGAFSSAKANIETTAGIGEEVDIDAGKISVYAEGKSDAYAESFAKTAGALSGVAAKAETVNVSTTEGYIGSGGNGKKIESDEFDVKADQETKFNSKTDSSAVSVVGKSGAWSSNKANALTTVDIGSNTQIKSDSVKIGASTTVWKPWLSDYNAISGSGGVFNGAAASGKTDVSVHTKVNIGNNAKIQMHDDADTTSDIEVSALNDLYLYDKVKLDAAGFISLAKSESFITAQPVDASINIGDGAFLKSLGDVKFFARTNADMKAQANTSTYGLASAGQGESKALADSDDTLIFGNNSEVIASKQMYLMAGADTDTVSLFSVKANTDVFNKTAFAYSGTPTADATARHNAGINIKSGSRIASGSHMYINAAKGLLFANGNGKASDASRYALEKLIELFGTDADGAFDTLGGHSVNEGKGSIILEGKLETGIYRDLFLTFGTNMFNPYYKKDDGTKGRYTIGYDAENGFWAVYNGENRLRILVPDQQSEGISWTVLTDQRIVDNIQQEIDRLENLKNQYGANSELAQDINTRINILKAQLNSQGNDEYVDIIKVNPAYAASGDVNIWGDYLVGTGEIIAPGDVKIRIINNSPLPIKLDSLTIPDDLGGKIKFNNHVVRDSSGISALNDGAPVGTVVNFTLQDAQDSLPPLIEVKNNFDKNSGVYNPDNIPDLSDPALFISGPINNINGMVSISNDTGSIIATSSIRADTIQLSAGGDFIFDSPETLYNIGPNPAAGFKYLAEAYENNWPVKPAYKGQSPSNSFQIAGNNIYINADTVNINGVIQSGLPDKAIVITQADVEAAYNEANRTGKRFVQILKVDESLDPSRRVVVGGISAELDARDNEIRILGAQVRGGLVFISGRIVSTGDGKINVLDGYGRINIDNQTSLPVVLKDVDTGGAEGQVILIDKAKDNGTGLSFVTRYERLGNQIRIFTNSGVNSTVATQLKSIATGRDAIYQPLENMRYFWMTGKATSSQTIKKWYKEHDKFLGFIPVSERHFSSSDYVSGYPKTRILSGDELPQGDFVGQKHAADYTYKRLTVTTKNDLIHQDDSEGTYWYWHPGSWWHPPYPAKKTWWRRTQIWDKGTNTYNYHSVKADLPIDVSFIGYDRGQVSVNSVGDIRLGGNLNNVGGVTNLTSSAGSILSKSSFSSVKSGEINLMANNGSIGKKDMYFKITHSGGNTLNALAGKNIYIESPNGDLFVTNLVTGSGSVGLIANDNLLLSNSISIIKGKNIYLEAKTGTIGAPLDVLRVDTDAANGGVIDVISAKGDINLMEVSGDLAIHKVSASGDVNIFAPGDIIDANSNEKADTRTKSELLALWNDMQLTGAGAENKKQSQWDAYSNTMNEAYKSYWSKERNLKRNSDGTYSWDAYDPNVEFHYSQSERDSLKKSGWSDKDIKDLENDMTDKYRTWGQTDFDPDFSYSLSDKEKDDLSSGYFWTQKQLEGGLPSFVLTKDTTLSIEDPNIVGRNVTVVAGGEIGKDKDDLIFVFSKNYTDAEIDEIKLAIASAERDDLEWGANQLVIHRREDLDVHASENVFLTATGHIFLGSEHDINVYALNAGDRVRVKVGGRIFNPRPDAFSNMVASNGIILEASNGQIGTVRSPVRIALSGDKPYVTARASGDIYLEKPLGDIYLDVINSGQKAWIKADTGSIFDWLDDSTTNIYADNIELNAFNSIGNPLGNAGALDVELTDANGVLNMHTNAGSANLFSNKDLNVGVSDIAQGLRIYSMGSLSIIGDTSAGDDVDFFSKGNMVFGANLNAKGKLVRLNPAGADILDTDNTSYIWADGLIMNNAGNVGAAGNDALDTRISYVAVNNGAGDIYISEVSSGGALSLKDISARSINISTTSGNLNLFSNYTITASGDVSLRSSDDIRLNGSVNAGSHAVTLNADGDIIDTSNDGKYLTAGTLNIMKANNVGSAGELNWLDIGVDTLNLSNVSGSAFIGEKDNVTLGNVSVGQALKLTALGKIAVDSVSCGTNADIRAYGAITDANGNSNNITAKDLKLRAESGIGENDAIETTVVNLDVVNTDNAVGIANTGTLNLLDLNNDGFSAVNTRGKLNISAASPLNVLSPVSSGGNITLLAAEDGGDDDILSVYANITSSGAGRIITLNSGSDFKQVSGNIITAGDIYINADYDGSGKGDIIQSNAFVNSSGLFATAAGNITMLHFNNDVNSLTARSKKAGNITFYDRDDIDLSKVIASNGSVTISALGKITATDVETSFTDNDANDISLTSIVSGIKAIWIDAGTKNDVFLTAKQGSITQDGVPARDVAADELHIDAQKGIDLDTRSNMLVADNSRMGNIVIDNTGGLYAKHVDNEGGDIHITTHSDLFVGDIQAKGDSDVYLNAASGSICDDLFVDPADTNYIRGDLVDLKAEDNIGDMSVFNGDIDIWANTINAVAGNDLYLEEMDGVTFNNISAGGRIGLTVHGPIVINRIISDGFINLLTPAGDITITGTVQSRKSGVRLTAENGSILAENAGPHVAAVKDSFLNAPNGKISPVGTPLNVSIKGDLYLDISNLSITYPTREIYGNLVGTITPLNTPILIPTRFPQPLNPPGFVYFNTKQIWSPKSNADYQRLAQLVVSRHKPFIAQYRHKFYNNPRYQQEAAKVKEDYFESLSGYRFASFEPATPLFYAYHPLTPTDTSAFDDIRLDVGAYEFIENSLKLKDKNKFYQYYEDQKKKEKRKRKTAFYQQSLPPFPAPS